jgi:hypothetical protein
VRSNVQPRHLFVTTALPYANGPFHIGHIMEYIQADIWVRFQRMLGNKVHLGGRRRRARRANHAQGREAKGVTPNSSCREDRRRPPSSISTAFTSLRQLAFDALAGERRSHPAHLPQSHDERAG